MLHFAVKALVSHAFTVAVSEITKHIRQSTLRRSIPSGSLALSVGSDMRLIASQS